MSTTAEQQGSSGRQSSKSRRGTNGHAKKAKADAAQADDLGQRTFRFTVEDREAMAKALRASCSRKALGAWTPAKKRFDPIDLLIETSKGRVETLVPIRYGRMMASPFAFFRGAAAIMAGDLAETPSTGIHLQICGDAHLVNFGGFATPERALVFDINDFDETTLGPWEWDIKRLCASMVVASRANGFNADDAKDAAWEAASAYRDHVAEYASKPILDAWYDHIDLQGVIDRMQDEQLKKVAVKSVRKAVEHTAHTKEFVKLTVEGGSPPRIQDEPPLIYHDAAVQDEVSQEERMKAFAVYRESLSPERRILLDRFEPMDTAVKVVGVGSVGTYCGIMLLVSGSGDPLFLQFKEARQSVIEPFIGKNPYKHQGQRVVSGQRVMQSASDIFLGWTQTAGRDFYVRQLRDAKISPQIELMRPSNLRRFARLCAHAVARAHARSADAVMLAAYLGKSDAFADAMTSFSVAYADQNERDHAALVAAARAGRVDAAVIQ
ncbi:MAG TPA: DUF2252 domain-containing protein [Dyella sp.]|uniref:DUF2252 domain-containing protein n=1 Tax=Dyella sp. TaxID=1869338 RepID=UPI002D7A02A4|nr:DUF2252 domain-containing protein [Dyella sp.]HET6555359.1 DUF2252 domain-containing protein [Dyella sp.]